MLNIYKYSIVILVGVIMSGVLDATSAEQKAFTPRPYVVANQGEEPPKILTTKAAELTFPLSAQDAADVDALEQQFDYEGNCAGLAAPQIGIAKQIIVFAAPYSEELKKWRPDLTQTMPKTVWINPKFEGIESEGMHVDYEGCFSVGDRACAIKRFRKIKYTAYDRNGNKIEGIAEGFVARIIQHEIDHVNGTLCISKAEPGSIMTIAEYREKRKKASEIKN